MTRSWHDLYMHGEHLNSVCKRFITEFKKAEEENNDELMMIWGEALRKVTMNTVEIAKTVLGVEELIRGKRVMN